MEGQIRFWQDAAVGGFVGDNVVEDFDEFRDQTDGQQGFGQLLQGPFFSDNGANEDHCHRNGENDQMLRTKQTVHIITSFQFFFIIHYSNMLYFVKKKRKWDEKFHPHKKCRRLNRRHILYS